jgi:hypothetical protein
MKLVSPDFRGCAPTPKASAEGENLAYRINLILEPGLSFLFNLLLLFVNR